MKRKEIKVMITFQSERKYYSIIYTIYIHIHGRERLYSTLSTGCRVEQCTVYSGPNIVSRAGQVRERRQQTTRNILSLSLSLFPELTCLQLQHTSCSHLGLEEKDLHNGTVVRCSEVIDDCGSW